ncbi:MAG: cobalamin-independent methionine synthase II family protein [Betaproteobacteria bacterium]|nr:cobalamin-independent methionine synthase II family protein [Betaproteobacteria bacterium]
MTTGLDRIRTDVVGSLLRPAKWKEARLRLEAGQLGVEEFAHIELDCVREHLRLQESIGLDVLTDGEISRLNFQDSFGLAVSGYQTGEMRAGENVRTHENRAAGGTPLARWDIPDLAGPGTPVVHRRPVVKRLQLVRNPPLEEYRRAAPLAKKPVKVSLIGPDRIMQRYDHANSKHVYASADAFLDDVVEIQRRMIGELVAAGCRYVHIDEPGYTAYVDEPSMEAMRKRGEDPMQNFARSLRANARLVAGFPGVTFGIHLCRGNQRSMWHREGVVLGLVSTKVPELEPVDALVRRVEEAAKHVPLERLAISPQCGFGSDVVGNLISEDDQKRKLERVVEAARRVWQ